LQDKVPRRWKYTYFVFVERFLPLIDVMADSFKKLKDLCLSQSPVLYWMSELESTMWIDNISQILSGVISIVELIDKGCSVVTHCRYVLYSVLYLIILVMAGIEPLNSALCRRFY
jgi:hypothetical protein